MIPGPGFSGGMGLRFGSRLWTQRLNQIQQRCLIPATHTTQTENDQTSGTLEPKKPTEMGALGRVSSRRPLLPACKLFSSADHQHCFLSCEERLWSGQRNGDNGNDGSSSIYCRLINCQALFLMLYMYSTFI